MISLDSVINTIQRRHHDVRANHIALGNDCAVHDFGLYCAPIFLCPLADPALGTDGKHDSAKKKPTRFARNNPKIFLLGHTKIITAVNRTFPKI
jgi:hypothetical protein